MLFGLLFAGLMAEIGLRIFIGRHVDFDQVYRVYDPLLGHVHPADLDVRIPFEEHPLGYFDLVTNNQGLREDTPSAYERPPDTLRILVLGDSHTDGTVFNQEAYPNVLESLLLEASCQAEVLNGGVAAYDPLKELLWFHYFGRQYEAQIVLLSLYIGNDLGEVKPFESLQILDDGQVMIDGEPLKPREQSFQEKLTDLFNKSYLYSIFRWGVQPILTHERMSADAKSHRICRGCYFQSLNQANLFNDGVLDYSENLTRMRVVLQTLKEQVEATGAKFVVVLIPTKRQVEGPDVDIERYQQAAEALSLAEEAWDLENILLDALVNTSEEDNLHMLNLLPGLTTDFEAAKTPLYYFSDWHLNPTGHQAVGRELKTYLTENGLLSETASAPCNVP